MKTLSLMTTTILVCALMLPSLSLANVLGPMQWQKIDEGTEYEEIVIFNPQKDGRPFLAFTPEEAKKGLGGVMKSHRAITLCQMFGYKGLGALHTFSAQAVSAQTYLYEPMDAWKNKVIPLRLAPATNPIQANVFPEYNAYHIIAQVGCRKYDEENMSLMLQIDVSKFPRPNVNSIQLK